MGAVTKTLEWSPRIHREHIQADISGAVSCLKLHLPLPPVTLNEADGRGPRAQRSAHIEMQRQILAEGRGHEAEREALIR